MKKFFSKVTKQKSLLVLGTVFVLVTGTYFSIGLHGKISNLQIINDGVQTCVARVGQSYNAHLLQQNEGQFLQKDFFKTTDDCFAETISLSESFLSKGQSIVIKRLNEISSKTNWLHAKLDGKIINLSQDENTQNQNENLSQYYNQIEVLKYEVLEINQTQIDKLERSIFLSRIALALSAMLVFVFAFWQFSSVKRKNQQIAQIEQEAILELEAEDFVHERASKIIHQALNENDLEFCDKLFSKIQNSTTKTIKHDVTTEQIQPGPLVLPSTTNPTIEKNINLKEVNLQKIVSNVLKVLADTIATYDAQIDFDINDELFVMGEEEDYQYLFYNIIKLFLSNKMTIDGVKHITGRSKKLGGTLLLELQDNTIGYGQYMQSEKPIEMILSEEIATDLGIGLQFSTQYDSNRSVCGGKIQVIMRLSQNSLAEYTPRKLVSLRKGSKKEILQSFGL